MTFKGKHIYTYLNQSVYSGNYIRECYLLDILKKVKEDNEILEIIFDEKYEDYFLNQLFNYDFSEYRDYIKLSYDNIDTYYQIIPYLESKKKVKKL